VPVAGVVIINCPLNCLWAAQLHPFTSGVGFLNHSNGPNGLVATLADVGWIEREESDSPGRNR